MGAHIGVPHKDIIAFHCKSCGTLIAVHRLSSSIAGPCSYCKAPHSQLAPAGIPAADGKTAAPASDAATTPVSGGSAGSTSAHQVVISDVKTAEVKDTREDRGYAATDPGPDHKFSPEPTLAAETPQTDFAAIRSYATSPLVRLERGLSQAIVSAPPSHQINAAHNWDRAEEARLNGNRLMYDLQIMGH